MVEFRLFTVGFSGARERVQADADIWGQENMHLWFTKEEVLSWSEGAQKLAGYRMNDHYLGHCNEGHPIDMFRASDPSVEDI